MAILVTGGAGYIGSHTVLELLNAEREVVVLDNLSNSCELSLQRVEQITGKKLTFYKGDILDRKILCEIFRSHQIQAVIHFAALKSVGESVTKPLEYYQTDVTGSIVLLEEMLKAKVNCIIFSSSATVYGDPKTVPISEDAPTGNTTNPYGTAKYIVERILSDACIAYPQLSAVTLRYFNPIGAHESGLIGEDPTGVPNNLLPYVSQVAVGKLEKLAIFGNDYPTKDGTGVRDYIHVVDLALGHLKALNIHQYQAGYHIYNLGTGVGYSVLDIVNTFENINQVKVPYRFAPRRAGDIAICYADPRKALEKLGWKTERDLSQMMQDAWRWQKNNPNGFRG